MNILLCYGYKQWTQFTPQWAWVQDADISTGLPWMPALHLISNEGLSECHRDLMPSPPLHHTLRNKQNPALHVLTLQEWTPSLLQRGGQKKNWLGNVCITQQWGASASFHTKLFSWDHAFSCCSQVVQFIYYRILLLLLRYAVILLWKTNYTYTLILFLHLLVIHNLKISLRRDSF